MNLPRTMLTRHRTQRQLVSGRVSNLLQSLQAHLPLFRFAGILSVLAVASLLYLNLSSDVAATSYDVTDLEDRIARLQRQNEQAQLEIDRQESLDNIAAEASSRLKLGPPRSVIYVAETPSVSGGQPAASPPSVQNRASKAIQAIGDVVRQALAWLKSR